MEELASMKDSMPSHVEESLTQPGPADGVVDEDLRTMEVASTGIKTQLAVPDVDGACESDLSCNEGTMVTTVGLTV